MHEIIKTVIGTLISDETKIPVKLIRFLAILVLGLLIASAAGGI